RSASGVTLSGALAHRDPLGLDRGEFLRPGRPASDPGTEPEAHRPRPARRADSTTTGRPRRHDAPGDKEGPTMTRETQPAASASARPVGRLRSGGVLLAWPPRSRLAW